jgi:hypothetical protein
MSCVIQIIGTAAGEPSPMDGRYLVEYDPPTLTRAGWGKGVIRTSPEIANAKRFQDAAAAFAEWKRENGRRWYDGKPNRPLTAWTIEIRQIQ